MAQQMSSGFPHDQYQGDGNGMVVRCGLDLRLGTALTQSVSSALLRSIFEILW